MDFCDFTVRYIHMKNTANWTLAILKKINIENHLQVKFVGKYLKILETNIDMDMDMNTDLDMDLIWT